MPDPIRYIDTLRFSTRGTIPSVRRLLAGLVAAAFAFVAFVGSAAVAAPMSPSQFRRHVDRIPTTPLFAPTLRRTLAESRHLNRLDDPLALAAAAGNGKPGTPTYLIRLLAPLPDRNYRILQFSAASGPGGGDFEGVTFQYDEDSNTNQTYIFEHRAPANVVRVFAGTRRARLVIDSNLASVDMRFTPTHDTHRHTFGCDTFLAPEASTVTWTIGRLEGEFGFTPSESFLETHPTGVRAAIERIVPTGEHCPPFSGGFCPRQWNFGFDSADTNFVAYETPPRTAPGFFGIHFVGGRRNFEWQLLEGMPLDGHLVSRPEHQVIVHGGNAGPFLSGHIAFDQGLARRRDVCGAHAILHRFTWSSGTLELRYDAGPVGLTGSALRAGSILVYHRHS